MQTRKQIHDLFSGTGARRLPLTEILPMKNTPQEVFQKFHAFGTPGFALESDEPDAFAYVGVRFEKRITLKGNVLTIEDATRAQTTSTVVSDPKNALERLLLDYTTPTLYPYFCGGLAGYFAYDFIQYTEPTLELRTGNTNAMELFLVNDLIVFDFQNEQMILIAGIVKDDPGRGYDEAVLRIEAMRQTLDGPQTKAHPPLRLRQPLRPACPAIRYEAMVRQAKRYIEQGEIFQVVLSNPCTALADGSLFSVYETLRQTNPGPYLFYFAGPDIEMAGSSPETLVRVDHDHVATFPLAGTCKRAKEPHEDERLMRDLLRDEKELAEHRMLVDLGRNDLGKVCRCGSVDVTRTLDVVKCAQVMHLSSTITGVLAPGKTALDALFSTLPAGTLSGAPKIRACEIIDELESAPRGVYGGAFGFMDFSGRLDFCIAIRFATLQNGVVRVQSGAGIVFDSIPEHEAQECQNKARAIVQALEGESHAFAH